MKPIGMIRGFSSYTPEQLQKMRSDLSLSLPIEVLQYFAGYYGNTARRDPAIDELKLLDTMLERIAQTPDAWAPSTLQSKNSFVAQTYSDLLQKRKELNPQAKHPCTLTEALGVASRYLERIGRRHLHNECALIEEREHYTLGGLGADNTLMNANDDLCVRLLPIRTATVRKGDLFAMIVPSPTQNACKITKITEQLLDDPTFANEVKQLETVRSCGLFSTLLELADSFYLEMNKLSRTGDEVPLSMLNDCFSGAPLFLIAPQSYEKLHLLAKEHGIRFVAVAAVTDDMQVTVRRQNGELFSLHSSFLHALHLIRTFTAVLPEESGTKRLQIGTHTLSAEKCRYLTNDSDHALPMLSLCNNSFTAASANVCAADDPFLHSLYCTLLPVTRLALSGCSCAQQRLVISLKLPHSIQTPEIAGKAMASLLGLYRAQVELAIPAATSDILFSKEAEAPSLTVFSIDRGNACPDTLQQEGSTIVCFTPSVQADGMPDFSNLRTLLASLCALRRNGQLISARVLINQSLTEALCQMQTDTLICHFDDNSLASEGECHFAILAEMREAVDGARLIGHTLSTPSRAEEGTCFPNLSELPTFYGSSRVTVLSQKRDVNARLLTEYFVRNGANASLFDESCEADALAASLIASQVLILCGEVTLPASPRTDFALDTFCRAEGTVLALSPACPTDFPNAICLPNGIPETILRQICNPK